MTSPIVKWAGGKRQIAHKIAPILKQQLDSMGNSRLVIPFAGGLGMTTSVLPPRLWINDVNPRLINLYRCVKNNVNKVISHLCTLDNTSDAFYKNRTAFNQAFSASTMDESCFSNAALFLYLNKTCFRGLYRENGSGGFNVPYGNYKAQPHLKAPFLSNLGNMALYLRKACPGDDDITCLDFESVINAMTATDVCYCDPPYAPIVKGQFVGYNKSGFKKADQDRLNESLRRSKCPVILSNSPAPDIITYWAKLKGVTIEQFCVNRRMRVYHKDADSDTKPDNEMIITYNQR